MTRGLWELSSEELAALAVALARRGEQVVTESGLQRDGFDVAVCARLVGLPASTAQVVVEAVRDERVGNPRPELELVWTGREAGATQTRDAGQVLPAMFGRATQRVLVAGFAFYEASTLFAPLHARARDAGVTVEFFIHVDGTGHDARMTPASFFRWSRPWRDVLPTVYYDARADDGDASSTMHAKCVVIDDREALITSANFTERAHRANIELGVLVTDRRFASRVAGQWRALVGHGLFRAYVPS